MCMRLNYDVGVAVRLYALCLFISFFGMACNTKETDPNRAVYISEVAKLLSHRHKDTSTAIPKFPENTIYDYLYRASVLLERYQNSKEGSLDEITGLIDKAYSMNGNSSDVYVVRACLNQARMYDVDSRHDAAKALELDNSNVLAYLKKADIDLGFSDFESAINNYNSVINGDNKELKSLAYDGLAKAYMLSTSVRDAQSAAQVATTQLWNRVSRYSAEDVASVLRKAIEYSPDNPVFYLKYALHISSYDFQKAEQYANKAAQLGDVDGAKHVLARIHLNKGVSEYLKWNKKYSYSSRLGEERILEAKNDLNLIKISTEISINDALNDLKGKVTRISKSEYLNPALGYLLNMAFYSGYGGQEVGIEYKQLMATLKRYGIDVSEAAVQPR